MISLFICLYIYIYIYIYMCVCVCVCGCVCVGLCVCLWMGAQEGILSLASLKWHQSVQKTFLGLLWHEDHTKSCAYKNPQDRERRMKRVSQLGVRPRSSQSGAEKQSVKSETLEHGVKTQSNEDDGQMS